MYTHISRCTYIYIYIYILVACSPGPPLRPRSIFDSLFRPALFGWPNFECCSRTSLQLRLSILEILDSRVF